MPTAANKVGNIKSKQMENTKKTIEEMVTIVTETNNYATMYSKDDVLRILADLKNEGGYVTDEQLEDLDDTIINSIGRLSDICSDFQLELNNDRISVMDYDIDYDIITDNVSETIRNFFKSI